MFLQLSLVPTDTTGADQTAVTVAINTEYVSAVLPLGSGCMLIVDGVGFKASTAFADMVAILAMERFAYVPVTYDGDDATVVTVALNVGHVSHAIPFSDSGCQVRCGGTAFKATESIDDVMSRLHAIEARWQGPSGPRAA